MKDNTSRRVMWATIVIAAATCIYVFFSWLQWRTMSEQLSQMIDASKQTNALITETHTLADNAGKQADNIKNLVEATGNQVRKLESLVTVAHKQNEAMRGQLITMQKQLELTDRPWIKAELKTISPLTFYDDNKQFTVDYRITLKNIGRSVATRVRFDFRISLIHPINMYDSPSKNQKIILDRLSSTNPDPLTEDSIFPNEEKLYAKTDGVVITKDADPDYWRTGRVTNIIPSVVGCVEYQFASSPTRHYTCVNYLIRRRDPLKGVEQGVIHVGEDVSAENMFLDPHVWGGRLTN